MGAPATTPSDFLETLNERSFFTPPAMATSSLMAPNMFSSPPDAFSNGSVSSQLPISPTPLVGTTSASLLGTESADINRSEQNPLGNTLPILPAATKAEQFLLTAADQEPGSRDQRLNRVIRSKYEAGLLKPYNYVKGYARLSRWMDRK